MEHSAHIACTLLLLAKKAVPVQAIKEGGASSVVERGPKDRGFDIAVWADELGVVIGNPLLIEIKSRRPNKEFILERLLPQLQASQSRLVLLLYHEGDPKYTGSPAWIRTTNLTGL